MEVRLLIGGPIESGAGVIHVSPVKSEGYIHVEERVSVSVMHHEKAFARGCWIWTW